MRDLSDRERLIIRERKLEEEARDARSARRTPRHLQGTRAPDRRQRAGETEARADRPRRRSLRWSAARVSGRYAANPGTNSMTTVSALHNSVAGRGTRTAARSAKSSARSCRAARSAGRSSCRLTAPPTWRVISATGARRRPGSTPGGPGEPTEQSQVSRAITLAMPSRRTFTATPRARPAAPRGARWRSCRWPAGLRRTGRRAERPADRTPGPGSGPPSPPAARARRRPAGPARHRSPRTAGRGGC